MPASATVWHCTGRRVRPFWFSLAGVRSFGVGQLRQYLPDFRAMINDRGDPDDHLKLILECQPPAGHGAEDKQIKVAAGTDRWVPAINTHGGFGRWAHRRSCPSSALSALL
jgi:hypothetical protein